MSDTVRKGINNFKQNLSIFPDYLTSEVIKQLKEVITYEPVIGIMGKTGVGKSSLCNALFRQPLSPVSNVASCTREAIRFTLNTGGRVMTLVDLPGVGESLAYDQEYRQLYQSILPELDLILWVMKADDRASTTDEQFYQFLREIGVSPERIVFVLNQADKAEPSFEWEISTGQPSLSQQQTLFTRSQIVARQFSSPYPVSTVSARTGYNLHFLVETMVIALPSTASSGVFRQLRSEYCGQQAETTVRHDFGELLGELFTQIVEAFPLPQVLRSAIQQIRERLVNTASALWHWFF